MALHFIRMAAAHIAASPTGRCQGGENNLTESKLVLHENGRGVSNFRLTL